MTRLRRCAGLAVCLSVAFVLVPGAQERETHVAVAQAPTEPPFPTPPPTEPFPTLPPDVPTPGPKTPTHTATLPVTPPSPTPSSTPDEATPTPGTATSPTVTPSPAAVIHVPYAARRHGFGPVFPTIEPAIAATPPEGR